MAPIGSFPPSTFDPAVLRPSACAQSGHRTPSHHPHARAAPPRGGDALVASSVFEKSLDPAAVSSILLSEPVAASCAFSVVVWQALSPSAWTLARAVRRRRKRARCQVLFLCGYRARAMSPPCLLAAGSLLQDHPPYNPPTPWAAQRRPCSIS